METPIDRALYRYKTALTNGNRHHEQTATDDWDNDYQLKLIRQRECVRPARAPNIICEIDSDRVTG